jgi:hypothetical protein
MTTENHYKRPTGTGAPKTNTDAIFTKSRYSTTSGSGELNFRLRSIHDFHNFERKLLETYLHEPNIFATIKSCAPVDVTAIMNRDFISEQTLYRKTLIDLQKLEELRLETDQASYFGSLEAEKSDPSLQSKKKGF